MGVEWDEKELQVRKAIKSSNDFSSQLFDIIRTQDAEIRQLAGQLRVLIAQVDELREFNQSRRIQALGDRIDHLSYGLRIVEKAIKREAANVG